MFRNADISVDALFEAGVLLILVFIAFSIGQVYRGDRSFWRVLAGVLMCALVSGLAWRAFSLVKPDNYMPLERTLGGWGQFLYVASLLVLMALLVSHAIRKAVIWRRAE